MLLNKRFDIDTGTSPRAVVLARGRSLHDCHEDKY